MKASFRDDTQKYRGEIRVLKLKNEKLEEMIENQNQSIMELSPKPKKGKVVESKRLDEE